MTVFVTGATGFIGSYVVTNLLEHSDQNLLLLVRASCRRQAAHKLWKALQLHMQFDRFLHYLQHRIELVPGDLTAPELGLDPDLRLDLGRRIESIVHCAASLNRKSAKACFNVNLRGTLSLAKLARAAHEHHGLRRLSEVSTTAVAGKREHELVREEDAIDWSRSDYDPYARTKKFCEHMLCELLPDVPLTIFRPSIVLGDSRFAETTQFDMAIAFAALARTPVLPFDPDARLDIVPADFVGRAIATIHLRGEPKHPVYHLSSGPASLSYKQIVTELRRQGYDHRPLFAPKLTKPA
ncbi:MAG: SDR family oxidoreductase, partial [Proteobacteria bacterium]|nr:SDR family oxidoreductase [Pseudomonadota bacterium]